MTIDDLIKSLKKYPGDSEIKKIQLSFLTPDKFWYEMVSDNKNDNNQQK